MWVSTSCREDEELGAEGTLGSEMVSSGGWEEELCVVRFEALKGEGHVAWPRVARAAKGRMVDDFMLASNCKWERVDKASG